MTRGPGPSLCLSLSWEPTVTTALSACPEVDDRSFVSAVNTPSLNKFLPASNLKPGTHLKTPDGQTAVVVGGSVPADQDGWMWDLTVQDDHDFYVEPAVVLPPSRAGPTRAGTEAAGVPVLVHNCGTGTVYRSDTRGPDEIFNSGFEPRGSNMDIMEHASGYSTDSGYVSTTKYESIAQGRGGNVYHIDGVDGVDVNEAWPDNPFASEEEIAVPGSVDPSRIIGVRLQDGTWMDNPNYVPPGE